MSYKKSVGELEDEIEEAISAIIKDKKIPSDIIHSMAVVAVAILVAFCRKNAV